MRRLVIDTASRACSVALFDDMECIDARHEVIGRGHAERLIPMIAELPERGLADIISVNVGPGSFTGIRVGLSAAKALALAWNVPCEGYNGLALLAAIIRKQRGFPEPVEIAVLGGHGEFFVQSFNASGEPSGAIQSLRPEDAALASTAPLVAGDAASAIVQLRGAGEAVDVFADARAWPEIAFLQHLPASAVYVRGPDARLPGAN